MVVVCGCRLGDRAPDRAEARLFEAGVLFYCCKDCSRFTRKGKGSPRMAEMDDGGSEKKPRGRGLGAEVSSGACYH